MEFRIDRFYRLNRRALTWAAFFALIYLLRDYFALLFLMFVISFFAYPACQSLIVRAKINRVFAITFVYACLLACYAALGYWIVPRLIAEVSGLQQSLPKIQQSVKELRGSIMRRYPEAAELVETHLPEDRIDEAIEGYNKRLEEHLPHLAGNVVRLGATLLAAICFSYLILMDIARLTLQLKRLSVSRLRHAYAQAAEPVVRFGYVVGKAMQAQGVIAVANTALTTIGLLAMGLPSVAMLSAIVFLCSFIPVIGVFISTTPIVLIALNSSGPGMALAAIGFVLLVHLVEAYVLNPLIYGQHLKLNPVMVLFILYIGHHGFGVWGMMLGVPVVYYVLHDVLGVPVKGEDPAKSAAKPAEPESGQQPDAPAEKTLTGT